MTQDARAAELYIDRGKDCEAENRALFDQLLAHRDEIEQRFGGALQWEGLEGKRACRIRCPLPNGGYRAPDEGWSALQDEQIKAMTRMEAALRPYITRLRGER